MIVAIIQARMASTRLPGKVLKDLVGHPLLWHVIQRVSRAKRIDKIVVATSTKTTDDPIEFFCAREGIACLRGSEEDVLDRYYQAARQWKAEVVVRITGDCPLIDPEVTDRVIEAFQQGEYDYVSNILRYTYPNGLDVEVFSYAALTRAWQEAQSPTEREHVTPYLRNSGEFRVSGVENEIDLSPQDYRWTVDEPSDLEFVREVYRYLYRENQVFLMGEILNLLAEHPELLHINPGRIRNEGYYLSITREKEIMEAMPRSLPKTMTYLARGRQIIGTPFGDGESSSFGYWASPPFLARGQGSHVWDVDGNEYIDYSNAMGLAILGYNDPVVTEATIKQIRLGTPSLRPHYLEVELAEMLLEIIPWAEMVHFTRDDAETRIEAFQVAQGVTGRKKIACCGYLPATDGNGEIPIPMQMQGETESLQDLTLSFAVNDLKSLQEIFITYPRQIAAVLIEAGGVVEPQADFFLQVKKIAHGNGALLIFDEVFTGFRLALGGAVEYFRVTPDLACYGSNLANGFPLSAVAGRKEVMKLFAKNLPSFSFRGEGFALAAAIANLKKIREKNVIAHLWEQGQRLKDGYNVLARELGLGTLTQCLGFPPRTVMTFRDRVECTSRVGLSLLQQELGKRGVLLLADNNICYCHSDTDVDRTLRAYWASLEVLKKAIENGNPCSFIDGDPTKKQRGKGDWIIGPRQLNKKTNRKTRWGIQLCPK
jgi:glutamate-1-semialdehyde aminotransferase/spore coat polysaccharide biosynthesis protein SpsF (cytidylyltransferase family)